MKTALTLLGALLAAVLAGGVLAAPAGAAPARYLSTGTVVVAKSDASGTINTVGTSTITVAPGATVQQVQAQLVAKDRSKQDRVFLDASGDEKQHGAVASGDQLRVTSADGQHAYTYTFAVHDPNTRAKDGVYWNADRYDQVDGTVNANTPVFVDRHCDITDPKYASLVRQVVDGAGSSPQFTVWYYGDAINAAIADCSAQGGGIVAVPAAGSRNGDGSYYSGAITLRSGVDLDIAAGATVKFVRDPSNAFYPVVLTSREGTDLYNYSPPVYALGQHDIAITGAGTLDAQDNVSHWQLPEPLPGAPTGTNTVLNTMNYEDVPVDERIFSDDGHLPASVPTFDGHTVRYVPPPANAIPYASTFTPNFIEFNHSTNILVEGVHVRNTIFWQVHPLNSQNVLIRDVDIADTAHHTDDGIDPESCDDVVIERSQITALDDGIAIKSGRNVDGRTHRQPSQNLIIRGDTFNNPNGGSASISIGSEMSGGVRNVFAENNVSGGAGTAYVLKIKTNSYRGGVVQGIYVRNSIVTQTIRGIANFDTNYSESVRFPNADVFNPTIRGIYFDNVNAAPSVSTTFPAFVVSSSVSRSPTANVYYRDSVFFTTATFESAFSRSSNRFFANLVIQNVTFVNPATQARTVYNAASPRLLDQTTASGGGTVSLRADALNAVPQHTFTLTGRAEPGVEVSAFLDRDPNPVPVSVEPDGSFTTAPITLDNEQYWYIDRHYVAINLNRGLDINTVVYQVAAP